MTLRLLACVAIAGALVVAGCGSDKTKTVERTVTQPVTTGASQTQTAPSQTTTGGGQPGLQSCPSFSIAGQQVSAVQATVDCSQAKAVASDVLSRDDCVEESPGGANTCTAMGYDCTTRIERRAGASAFVVSCQSGQDRVLFERATG